VTTAREVIHFSLRETRNGPGERFGARQPRKGAAPARMAADENGPAI